MPQSPTPTPYQKLMAALSLLGINQETLPPLPELPQSSGPILVLSGGQWRKLVARLEWQAIALQALWAVQAPIVEALEENMASLDDLQEQLVAIKQSESAESAVLAAMGTALTTIIGKLHELQSQPTLDQDKLNALVAEATSMASDAMAQAAQVGQLQSQADAENQPPPASTPRGGR